LSMSFLCTLEASYKNYEPRVFPPSIRFSIVPAI
jgi:hypothetical protein